MRSSPYSRSVQFLPTSPTPPRGITLSRPGRRVARVDSRVCVARRLPAGRRGPPLAGWRAPCPRPSSLMCLLLPCHFVGAASLILLPPTRTGHCRAAHRSPGPAGVAGDVALRRCHIVARPHVRGCRNFTHSLPKVGFVAGPTSLIVDAAGHMVPAPQAAHSGKGEGSPI